MKKSLYKTTILCGENRGTSSDGRALALHARGTGIDAPVLQSWSFLSSYVGNCSFLVTTPYHSLSHEIIITINKNYIQNNRKQNGLSLFSSHGHSY